MEKFNLIVLLLDKNSMLFDNTGQKLNEFIREYALTHATLVVIYIGGKANRVFAGQHICDIDTLPDFDESEGENDVIAAIQRWVYEAQANMYSGSAAKLRTGIFADVCDELINIHHIKPAEILGNLEETEYFQVHRQTNSCELIEVSKIEKLEALAKNGDEKALYELGLAYVTGEGVKKDEPKAQILLYKAYLRGNIDAIFALVDLFDDLSEHFRNEAAKHRNFRGFPQTQTQTQTQMQTQTQLQTQTQEK